MKKLYWMVRRVLVVLGRKLGLLPQPKETTTVEVRKTDLTDEDICRMFGVSSLAEMPAMVKA